MDDSRPTWYCARTKPKHEHIAAAGLVRNLGLEVFNPRLKIERPTRRGIVHLVEPLFPCYIFVRCSLLQCRDEIRYVNGVNTLVHFGQKVAAVPDQVIADLQRTFEPEVPFPVEDRLRAGDEVTVAEGAFLGFRGTVVRLMSANQRVQILLDFLGQLTMAEFDRQSLLVENRSMADLMPFMARPISATD